MPRLSNYHILLASTTLTVIAYRMAGWGFDNHATRCACQPSRRLPTPERAAIAEAIERGRVLWQGSAIEYRPAATRTGQHTCSSPPIGGKSMIRYAMLISILALAVPAHAQRFRYYFVTMAVAGGSIGMIVDGPTGQLAKSVRKMTTDTSTAYAAVIQDVDKQLGIPQSHSLAGPLPAGVFDWLGAKGAHVVQLFKSTTTDTWIFEQAY